MFEKQAEAWNYDGKKFSGQLAQQLDQLLDLSRKSADDDSVRYLTCYIYFMLHCKSHKISQPRGRYGL
jgi:hypothetical protein